MTPQDAATANAIANTVTQSILPLFVASVIGAFGWASWMTWSQRAVQQTVDSLKESLGDIDSQLDAVEETLEAHRRDDAKSFAELRTEFSMSRGYPAH